VVQGLNKAPFVLQETCRAAHHQYDTLEISWCRFLFGQLGLGCRINSAQTCVHNGLHLCAHAPNQEHDSPYGCLRLEAWCGHVFTTCLTHVHVLKHGRPQLGQARMPGEGFSICGTLFYRHVMQLPA
jgi:hypothetical protein